MGKINCSNATVEDVNMREPKVSDKNKIIVLLVVVVISRVFCKVFNNTAIRDVPIYIFYLSVVSLFLYVAKNILFKSGNTSKKTSISKIGKYYDPTINYETLIQQEKDNGELEELETDWQTSIDYLREQIELFEGQVITAETEKDKLMIKARLQPLYEQLKVGEDFIGRFSSVNNLPLLKEMYHSGTFVSLEEAEKIKKKYDDILYFQTSTYKNAKKISVVLIIFSDLLATFLYVYLLGYIGEEIAGPIVPSYIHHFSDTFGVGLGILLYGSVVTLPILGFICFFAIPKLIKLLIIGNRMSEADIKAEQSNTFMGITASAIAGGMIHHHIKKNKKEYK